MSWTSNTGATGGVTGSGTTVDPLQERVERLEAALTNINAALTAAGFTEANNA